VPVEVLSNQESKQPGTINNALKMQRVLFHRNHAIENKLIIIIHADKISVQEEINFSQTKPRVFARALHFETYKNRRSPLDVPSPNDKYCQHRSKSFVFQEKTRELQGFKSKLF
jgi:hypothetical protein